VRGREIEESEANISPEEALSWRCRGDSRRGVCHEAGGEAV